MKIRNLLMCGAIASLCGCSTVEQGIPSLASLASNIKNDSFGSPQEPNADLGKGYTCIPMENPTVLTEWCVDRSTIKPYAAIPGAKQANFKFDFVSANNYSNMGYITSMQKNVFDCKAGTMGVLNYTYYTESGDVFQQSPSDAKLTFAAPEPNTLGYQILEGICK